MSKALNICLGVLAVLAFAPWAVYLAGIAKLTDVFNDRSGDFWTRQLEYMLEWYEIWAELALIIIILVASLAGWARRTGGFLQMMLAVNTALIIYSATLRIIQVNRIDDGTSIFTPAGGLTFGKTDLDYLRAIAAGQVATAAWNFVLAILLSLAASADHTFSTAVARKDEAHAHANAA